MNQKIKSLLQGGEEFWEYCEKFKQYKDPLHVDGTLEEYQLPGVEGLTFIGFIVQSGDGRLHVSGQPNLYTAPHCGISSNRFGFFVDKALIIGAVMKAGE